MILKQFDYVAPTTLGGALSALREPGSVILAGGHHLLTLLKRRELEVRTLVDLAGVRELRGIEPDGAGGLRIGALTTLTGLLEHLAVRDASAGGALGDALSASGDRQSRNRVTVGGQLASGRTGNDLAAALMVLGTTVHIAGEATSRTVELTELWGEGPDLDLRRGELVTGVHLGSAPAGSAYARMADRATLDAVCGVAVAVVPAPGGGVEECRVAAVGATVRPGRLPTLEDAVRRTGNFDERVLPDDVPFIDDHLARADYRRYMTCELGVTALKLALDRTETPLNS